MSTTTLEAFWDASQRVVAAENHGGRATNASCARYFAAMNVELIALGIAPRDHNRSSGPNHAWWSAQNSEGHIIGIWADSYEEAVIALGASWRAPIVWCVPDTKLEVRNRYPRGKQGEPCIHPVTEEPIPGPEFAALTPLF